MSSTSPLFSDETSLLSYSLMPHESVLSTCGSVWGNNSYSILHLKEGNLVAFQYACTAKSLLLHHATLICAWCTRQSAQAIHNAQAHHRTSIHPRSGGCDRSNLSNSVSIVWKCFGIHLWMGKLSQFSAFCFVASKTSLRWMIVTLLPTL